MKKVLKYAIDNLVAPALSSIGTSIGGAIGKRVGRKFEYVEPKEPEKTGEAPKDEPK
jgi:hypothetical protein